MHLAKFSSAARLLTALALISSTAFYVSCDSTARIFLRLVQFDRMQVVSVTPVKESADAGGNKVYVPACSGDATHVRFNFNLKSTQRNPRDGDPVDRDLQIRPGEDAIGKSTVQLGKTISEDNFDLTLTCLEPHSGSELPGSCDGNSNPASAKVDNALEFLDMIPGNKRGTPVGVAILIDQTGSTNGTVDGTEIDGNFGPTCLEAKQGAVEQPSKLDLCASDDKNLRITATKDLIGLMNDHDRNIVFQFSEDAGVSIVCEIPGIENPDEQTKALNCYQSDRRFALGDGDALDSAVDALQGRGSGRSNLWSGVSKAFEFMKPQPEAAKHIVVIADGPDTCNPSSAEFQSCFQFEDSGIKYDPEPQEACPGATSYNAARDAITAHLASLGSATNNLHVSFIHFQAKGYPAADPRMQEIACMTGGHYVFINANNIAENSNQRKVAFSEAVAKLRYAMSGHWSLVTAVSSYSNDSTSADAKRGQVHAFEGSLTMTPNAMVNADQIVPFGFGEANHDQRLAIAKSCRNDADCGTEAGTTACGIRCDLGSRTCTSPAVGTACEANTGVCCQGTCAAGQTLCTTPVSACP